MSDALNGWRDEPLAVFAYAFPHRKTQDFLIEIATWGYRDVTVIAAPWRKVPNADPASYFQNLIRNAEPLDPGELCERLSFAFFEIEHDDVEEIERLHDRKGFRLGIIAGARILKRGVIDLFQEGILNFHPGKIPETSGLDSFYYSIKNHVPLGATAHYIDRRVDAGDILFFEETLLDLGATPEIVQHNNYQAQIRALRRFFALRDAGCLQRAPAERPGKNQPMDPEEKRALLLQFPDWLARQVRRQAGDHLIDACRGGDVARAAGVLAQFPDLIGYRTEQGWTPLTVAERNHHCELVRLLIDRGAIPTYPAPEAPTR